MANLRVQEFKKDLILQSARELFANNCFEAVTVDDIAHEAGFSKATLYVFFSSKEEILFNVLRNGLENFIIHMQEIINNSPDSIAALDSIMSQYYLGFREYAGMTLAFIRRKEGEAVKPEWSEEITRLAHRKTDLIANVLARGMQENLLPEQDPINLARILDAMIKGISHPNVTRDAPNGEKDLEIFKNIIFHGILQEKQEGKQW